MAGWHLEIGRFPNAWEGFTIRKDVDMNQMLVETHRVSWEFGDLRWDDSKVETIPKHKKKCSERPCQYSTTHRHAVSSTTSSFMMLQCGLCLFRTEPVYITQSSECFLKFPFSLQHCNRHKTSKKSPLSPPSISMVWLLASNNWKFAAGHGVGHPEKIQAIIGLWEPLSK